MVRSFIKGSKWRIAMIGYLIVGLCWIFSYRMIQTKLHDEEQIMLQHLQDDSMTIHNSIIGKPDDDDDDDGNRTDSIITRVALVDKNSTTQSKVVVSKDASHKDSPRLWLHVDDVSEGMANWMIAVVELLVVSKEIGAALIEPCILEGRITSCHKVRGKKKIQLGQIFDLEKLRAEVHPWIVSQEDYETAIKSSSSPPNTFTFCMHHGNPGPIVLCHRSGKLLDNFHGVVTNHILQEAVTSSAHMSQDKSNSRSDSFSSPPTVIEIHTYRKHGFAKTKLQNQSHKLVNESLVREILHKNLVFHRMHYDHVKRFLHQMGIHNGENSYNVIHWRAELNGIKYDTCVDHLVMARKLLNDTIPTVLISSLNKNPWLQWGTSRSSGKATKPLQSLLDKNNINGGGGFLKLDDIPNKPTVDMIQLAVWDQILAEKALHFATCTKSCRKRDACSACNYRGSFGETAIALRKKANKDSLQCWPSKG